MAETTLKELLSLSIDWTVRISKFYSDFRDEIDDISFKNLLTTMIDQEGQYTNYYEENLKSLDYILDFNLRANDTIEINIDFEEMPDVKRMSKISFLKKAVHFQQISIKTCEFLGRLSKTSKGKQIFKELADEESRHMSIFKDHLELEELF